MFDFSNKKVKKIFVTVIAIVLIIGMVLPTAANLLSALF